MKKRQRLSCIWIPYYTVMQAHGVLPQKFAKPCRPRVCAGVDAHEKATAPAGHSENLLSQMPAHDVLPQIFAKLRRHTLCCGKSARKCTGSRCAATNSRAAAPVHAVLRKIRARRRLFVYVLLQ